jgi:predicted transposase/invertase (TIGR01784 family)
MKPTKKQTPTNTKRNKKMYYNLREKYIDPITDFGFKKLFGEECNKDLLLDFLNELLYEEQGRIVSISYLKSDKLGIVKDARKAIFDLYCENEKGEKFIVELQKSRQQFFKDRTLYYSTFPIIEQAPVGSWDFELKAVYTIAIVNFVFEEGKNDPKKYRYDVKLTDIETHKVFYDKLTFIYLEMPKFTKEIDELETRFEKWMYVFKNLKQLDNLPDKLRETVFEKIFAAAEIAKLTIEEFNNYAINASAYRDWNNCMDFAVKEAVEKATAKVTKKVTKKVTEKVTKKITAKVTQKVTEDVTQKVTETERKKMVINSHRVGIKLDTISVITGFTVDEVSAILKENELY